MGDVAKHKFVEETICLDDCIDTCTDEACDPSNLPQMGTDYCKICGLLYFTPEGIAAHED